MRRVFGDRMKIYGVFGPVQAEKTQAKNAQAKNAQAKNAQAKNAQAENDIAQDSCRMIGFDKNCPKRAS